MPNWTSNRLEAPTEVLKKYIGKDEDGKPFFDFNKVIPRPAIYDDPDLSSGNTEEWCIRWYLSDHGKTRQHLNEEKYRQYCQEHDEECYRRGEKYVNAFNKYGYKDWYDWSCANWGTKWNACDSVFDNPDEPKSIEFETAWCCPYPVIGKIMDDNPDCLITFTWEDEDYNGTHTLIRNQDGTLEKREEWI